MSIVVPNVGSIQILKLILTPNLTLRLYSNNVSLGPLNTFASFTEVVGGGYANKPLTFANWNFITDTPCYAIYAQQLFSFTGSTGGAVYGYYITDPSNNVMCAETLSSPLTPINGSSIRIQPKLTQG